MTNKTISILSHYHKSTCKVMNCSSKIRNLIVRRNLKVQKLSFDMYS